MKKINLLMVFVLCFAVIVLSGCAPGAIINGQTVQEQAKSAPASFVTTAPIGTTSAIWYRYTSTDTLNPVYFSTNNLASPNSQELYMSGFGFNVPANAVITGIKFTMLKTVPGGSPGPVYDTLDNKMFLATSPTTTISNNMKSSVKFSLSGWSSTTLESLKTVYGEYNNLWGATSLTPAVVNNPNFGILYSASKVNQSTLTGVSLRYITMTVYYIIPPTTVCTNQCTGVGVKQCAAGTTGSYQTCGDYNADTCFEWGTSTLCPTGQTCSGAGVCSTPAITGCTIGEKRCNANASALETCVAGATGAANTWSSSTCPVNYGCKNLAGTGYICARTVTTCTETDTMKDLNVKGTTTLSCPSQSAVSTSQAATDSCASSNTVKEYSCDSYTAGSCTLVSNDITCPTGQVCTDGKCTAGTVIPTEPSVGTGTGLTGTYYGATDFTDIRAVQNDAKLDFTNWVSDASPIAGVPGRYWAARWVGDVQAKYTDTYNFAIVADDGTRVWVNNQLIIDNWVNQAATRKNSSVGIAMTAGQKYSIKVEYYQAGYSQSMRLYWWSAKNAYEIVPTTQLYPIAITPICTAAEKTCAGSQSTKVCNANGLSYTPTACDAGQTCIGTTGKCVQCSADYQCNDKNDCTIDKCSSGFCTNSMPDKYCGISCAQYEEMNDAGKCKFSLTNVMTKDGFNDYYNNNTGWFYIIVIGIIAIIGSLIWFVNERK